MIVLFIDSRFAQNDMMSTSNVILSGVKRSEESVKEQDLLIGSQNDMMITYPNIILSGVKRSEESVRNIIPHTFLPFAAHWPRSCRSAQG
jgi:hypothetical protein